MTVRVGIVSAAWGAFAHLPAWRALDGVEVTAICTSRRETAEAAAERLQIARPFWDALEMCRNPDIDIVDLGTRPGTRLPWVLEALKHGKHIYIPARTPPTGTVRKPSTRRGVSRAARVWSTPFRATCLRIERCGR